jgi:hypothetical protein
MRNWFKELSVEKAERVETKTNCPTLESEVFIEFAAFLGLRIELSFVMCCYCHLRSKNKYVNSSELLNLASKHLISKEVEMAYEDLLCMGWLINKYDKGNNLDEQIVLHKTVELAIKKSNADLLPRLIENYKYKGLKQLIIKACFLRTNEISKQEWLAYITKIMLKPRAKYLIYLKSKRLSKIDNAMVLFATSIYIHERINNCISPILSTFSVDSISRFKLHAELQSNQHNIITQKLFFNEERQFGEIALLPSKEWLKAIFPELKVVNKIANHPALTRINYSSIHEKPLLFNSNKQNDILLFEKLLQPEHFKNYRLKASEMKEMGGLTFLFSGGPGTGKTELCKQLALKTHRDILLFNVSETKNKYYGETEKNVKSIFDFYRTQSHDPDKCPIIVFNEADSVFSKRSEGDNYSSQTENVIQTILLNELENFNGILIATTNLPHSFDEAFKRRFLFQFSFDLPDLETRKLLLTEYFPEMLEEEKYLLAEKYSFSAAELQNFRKHLLLKVSLINPQCNLCMEFEHYFMGLTSPKRNIITGFKSY